MAVHAGFGRRNSRSSGNFNAGVAIAAVNADGRYMVLMAERNWLLAGHAGLRHVARAVHRNNDGENTGDDKDRSEDAEFRKGVRAAVEDL